MPRPTESEFGEEPWETAEWRAANVAANRLLPRIFPELEAAYEREIVGTGSEDWSEDDGPHVVYSLVFYDFLESVLRTEPEDSELFVRTVGFLRFLMDNPDPDYVNLAQVGIGEFLEGMDLPPYAFRALPRGLLPHEWRTE